MASPSDVSSISCDSSVSSTESSMEDQWTDVETRVSGWGR